MSAEVLAAVGSALAVAAAVAQLDDAGVAWGRVGRARPTTTGGAAPQQRAAWHGIAAPAVIGGCIGLLLGGPMAAVMIGACAGGAAIVQRRRRAHQQRRARERAAPALARSLADALRGGASVRGAVAASAQDRSVPAPLRAALDDAARAVQLGAPIETALTDLAREGGPTLRLLCGTVVLHLEAGGSLARELGMIASDGEVAQRIDEDRVAATAQARATVRVVAALPVLALLGAEAASRDFLPRIASKPLPLAMLLLGFALEATAIAAARAIVGGRS